MTPEKFEEYFSLFSANYTPLSLEFDATVARLGLSREQIAELAGVVDLVYQSRIRHLDRWFGEVLSEIDRYGLTDQSLVVFAVDHGETLYDENRRFKWTHSSDLMPEIINVPLMIRAPGVEPQRIDTPTRSIDVYPTIAGLAGLDVDKEAGLQGVDLSGALRGVAAFPMLTADSHSVLRHSKLYDSDDIETISATRKEGTTLYRWRWTSKSEWRFEVFDLAASTSLTDNLFDPQNLHHKKVGEELWAYRRRLIQAYFTQNPAKAPSRSEESESLTESQLKALKSLGYIQ